MTKYSALEKIGPVTITAVDAELRTDMPRKYMLDCDHATFCDWGMAFIQNRMFAAARAREHAEHHKKNGPESKAWRSTVKVED